MLRKIRLKSIHTIGVFCRKMTVMKGRKFVNCFFKKEVLHSSSDLPKNLPTQAQKDQQEQSVDKPQTKLEKSPNPHFNQQLGKLSTGVDSKCTSKFFTFFYSAPQQNLAWCKVKTIQLSILISS